MRRRISCIVVVFLALSYSLFGQGFEPINRLTDLSGDLSNQDVGELENIKDSLFLSLPPVYQDSFKVYLGGGYSIEQNQSSSFDNSWSKLQSGLPNYYILFANYRTPNGENRVQVALKLPQHGKFSCIDFISSQFRSSILEKVVLDTENALELTQNSTYAIRKGIISLRDIIVKVTECCDISNRSITSGCNSCIKTKSDYNQEISARGTKLTETFSFKRTPLTSSRLKKTSNSYTYIDVNGELILGEQKIELQDFATEVQSSFTSDIESRPRLNLQASDISTAVFVKEVQTLDNCDYEEVYNQFLNYPADAKCFISIVKDGDKEDVFIEYNTNELFSYPEESDNITEENEESYSNSDTLDYNCGHLDYFDGHESYVDSPYELFPKSLLCVSVVHSSGLLLIRESYIDNEIATLNTIDPSSLYFVNLVKANWNLCGGTIHTLLDLCGVVLPVCDIVNTGLYVASGDYKNAAISLIAVIPAAGEIMIGKRLANNTGIACALSNRSLNASCSAIKIGVRLKDGIVNFGYRGKLANVMKLARGHAHHIIPWAFKGNRVVTQAAKTGWHMSDPLLNGKGIEKALHGSHYWYNRYVKNKLDDLIDEYPNISPEKAKKEIEDLVDDLVNKIDDAVSKSTKLNDYFRPLAKTN